MSDELTSNEQHTVEVYDRIAQERASQYSSTSYWQEQYEMFKAKLPKHAKVLDIGCGDGRDGGVFSAMGLDYTGIDLSEGMLTVAQDKHIPHATFLKRNMYQTGFPDHSFDGFWATSSLVHAPKSRIDTALQEAKRIIKPDGVGFIAMKKGEGEHTVPSTLKDDTRVWSFYTDNEFAKILQRTGFTITHHENYSYEAAPPYGTTWILFWVTPKKDSHGDA